MKFTIGISTYGPIPRAESLIRSLKQHLDKEYYDQLPTIILCDDGTPENQLGPRKLFCEREGVNLILHGENKGIPSVWNSLRRNAPPDTEAILILSDGVRFVMSGWLTALAYFLKHNQGVGTVGLPLLHRNINNGKFDPSDGRWDAPAGRVGAAVGAVFAFRPEIADTVIYPDGSTGFPETYIKSFHEEIIFGLKLAELGFLSWMLPFPPVSYLGGMAFSAHAELIWQKPTEYLPMEEFLKYARISPWYIPDYEEKYAQGVVDRMSHSRILMLKMYGLLEEIDKGNRFQEIKGEIVDILADPPKPVHHRFVDPWPLRKITWLDQYGHPQETVG